MANNNKELDELLTVLNSVILTRATKGGAKIVEIKKDYNELCGKEIDTRKFGFDKLETLLKSFKNKFYCQGERWFGETTKEAESIVQSMATEKSKKGKGSHKPSFERGPRIRSSFNRNSGPPRGFPLPSVQQNSSSRPFTPRNDIPFHHSSSDPRFNSSQQNVKLNKDERPSSSKLSGGTKNAQIPARFGFGNTSYNIASDTTSRSSLSSIDENHPEMDSDAPPPGFPSSRSFSRNTMEEPVYPPGLDVETIKKRAATPAHSNATPTNNENGQPIQLNNLEIARKVYALLLGFPQGLKVREISQRITLPQKSDEKMHDNARIGVAVTSYKQTFTISSFGPDGVVSLNPGAPRPGEASSPQEAFKTSYVRNSDDIDERRESGSENDYSDRFRRSDAQYRDNDDQHYARGPYTSEPESRSNRFSAPAYDPEPHRRSPTPNRSRTQNMPSGEEERFRMGWGGERLPRSWGDRNGRLKPSPNQPYEPRGGWPKDPERYSEYSDEPPRNGYQRRRVPHEPKKYECKHKYLMDSNEVPYEDFVKLTHFVALDEFYVRFESEEEQYQDMLAQLRDDYKGELEFARPQLWLKGDGAAVWFERQWQRGVVCTSIMNDAVSTLDVFLIDVGKTVTISKEQVLPLHSYYHKPPFAVCCTIGCFDIFHGRRPDLVEECKRMAEAFTTAPSESLSAEIEDKIWDDKEKLKVRLCFRKPTKRVFVPDYFVNEKIIDLR